MNQSKRYWIDIWLQPYSGLLNDEVDPNWKLPPDRSLMFRHVGAIAPDSDLLFEHFGWTPGYFYIWGSTRGQDANPISKSPYNLYDSLKNKLNISVDEFTNEVVRVDQ